MIRFGFVRTSYSGEFLLYVFCVLLLGYFGVCVGFYLELFLSLCFC